ncbi:peptidoglycan-binding protein [Phormidium pseudopriestleyi FRX01]|uniref:Peptidoglycan-binding protein n=1 Tax=Phormidium pseudopriestleyi FRX01 TaxID=1759528 RepID=A0ABS3FRH9_9CYAN|nr:peptidoglycan-binding domain-containing protein [Phormidium pseudopriestleyi]MBO0349725.1 peptidoglycan-binding protein [Phormidium pseudopriestleyi FRX01]
MLSQCILEWGSQGEDVKEIQQILLNMGYDLGEMGVDGKFGPKTEAAVKNFQGDINLQYPEATVIIDGQVSPQTWFFLKKANPKFETTSP